VSERAVPPLPLMTVAAISSLGRRAGELPGARLATLRRASSREPEACAEEDDEIGRRADLLEDGKGRDGATTERVIGRHQSVRPAVGHDGGSRALGDRQQLGRTAGEPCSAAREQYRALGGGQQLQQLRDRFGRRRRCLLATRR
jgi:hypothetical protein